MSFSNNLPIHSVAYPISWKPIVPIHNTQSPACQKLLDGVPPDARPHTELNQEQSLIPSHDAPYPFLPGQRDAFPIADPKRPIIAARA